MNISTKEETAVSKAILKSKESQNGFKDRKDQETMVMMNLYYLVKNMMCNQYTKSHLM